MSYMFCGLSENLINWSTTIFDSASAIFMIAASAVKSRSVKLKPLLLIFYNIFKPVPGIQ